jgi:drug/metabolite transporter (DMT)-like permease
MRSCPTSRTVDDQMADATTTSRLVGPTGLGLAFTLASAVLFSGLGVLTQLAFEAGAPVGTLLAGRFLVAAVLVWLVVWLVRARRPARRQALAGLALGVGFSAHAALFAMSLSRLDAGLVDLLLFTYPALVTLGAVLLGRDRPSRRATIALGTATTGTVLILIGGLGSIDPVGAALALASAVAYSVYILASAGQAATSDPLTLTALVSTGAMGTSTLAGAFQGDLAVEIGAPALALVAAVGLVAAAGMATFVVGIAKLGPARASIVSAVQPALTPILGFAAFGDRLGPAQMAGGALVVSAVVILESSGLPLGSRTWPGWLPRRERRALARAMDTVVVPAGLRLLRQGAPADEFFLIQRGRATVIRDGRPIAQLGPGDFFGEIALLRGGARTASVVASTTMRIAVVPRRRFAGLMRALPTLADAVRMTTQRRLVPTPAT